MWRCPISSGPLMRMASRSGRNLTSYNHSTLHTMRLYHITRRRHSITHTLSTCIHRCSTIRHKLLTILVLSMPRFSYFYFQWVKWEKYGLGENGLEKIICDDNLLKPWIGRITKEEFAENSLDMRGKHLRIRTQRIIWANNRKREPLYLWFFRSM